jgi:hypothetical protein
MSSVSRTLLRRELRGGVCLICEAKLHLAAFALAAVANPTV